MTREMPLTAISRGALLSTLGALAAPCSPDFAPVDERIAAFDNDGALWVEKPRQFNSPSLWIASRRSAAIRWRANVLLLMLSLRTGT